ncbi:FkbM family methyltransferase [Sphingomonas kyeonggiensis]|uniref:FkbM family methyltransferase n=1 Tax=Sphingomonas kyeonggiensis TaxID=1268553 RepID=A0A7W6NY21_9SPHN|nr:FkbM family methyltransferase [Sphingomonas kyeonggiensis]MBB4099276.1 FkbM family methyltransferase [Sphingomonas kyeonggiensis]
MTRLPTLFRRRPRPGSRTANEASIRSLCATAYLGDNRALVRVLGRYKMFVDTRDVDIGAHLLLDGFWEMWVTELLPQLIRPGAVCIDVGAHVGYFTLQMAELAGPSGRVHAFEPNSALRRMLDDSVRVNGFAEQVRSHGDPVFDAAGLAAELVGTVTQPSGAHVRILPEGDPAATLRTCRLDGIAGLDRADFVKIDAEASEEAIWRGMRGLLDQGRPMTVLLEFAAIRYADPGGFLGAITGEGFALHRIDPDQGLCRADVAGILRAPPAREQMLALIR